mmetsp:Transcript_140924/g.450593  ORF Transcript_140924/g.450593 Transcript_140924/m.450593 type:complete len:338 (-) Transcript_140924:276-1289(-)
MHHRPWGVVGRGVRGDLVHAMIPIRGHRKVAPQDQLIHDAPREARGQRRIRWHRELHVTAPVVVDLVVIVIAHATVTIRPPFSHRAQRRSDHLQKAVDGDSVRFDPARDPVDREYIAVQPGYFSEHNVFDAQAGRPCNVPFNVLHGGDADLRQQAAVHHARGGAVQPLDRGSVLVVAAHGDVSAKSHDLLVHAFVVVLPGDLDAVEAGGAQAGHQGSVREARGVRAEHLFVEGATRGHNLHDAPEPVGLGSRFEPREAEADFQVLQLLQQPRQRRKVALVASRATPSRGQSLAAGAVAVGVRALEFLRTEATTGVALDGIRVGREGQPRAQSHFLTV